MKIVLLLTACIEPTQFKNKVQRNIASVRLSDYKEALKLWLHHKDDKITTVIFAENSGYDLTEIEQIFLTENIFNRNYKIFQSTASEVPNGLHYGYSELELIDKVINEVSLINNEDFIIKATGRIYFPQISKLIFKTIPQYNFVADSRIYSFLKWNKNYVLSDLFITKVDWYINNLLYKKNVMIELNVSHFETLLFKEVYDKHKKNILLRFPFNVNPVGLGAHWNVNYQSIQKKISYNFRAIFRYLFPKIWI
ncbi:MAG: hypothetical protein WCI53_03785 [Bacteroidota bacterium]|jgi:hypothetical protein